jgi:hypothetical protein
MGLQAKVADEYCKREAQDASKIEMKVVDWLKDTKLQAFDVGYDYTCASLDTPQNDNLVNYCDPQGPYLWGGGKKISSVSLPNKLFDPSCLIYQAAISSYLKIMDKNTDCSKNRFVIFGHWQALWLQLPKCVVGAQSVSCRS